MIKRPLLIIWGAAAFSIICLLGFAGLNPVNGQEGNGFPRFLGRFHPLVLHFPVACLILAAIFEAAKAHPLTRPFSKLSGPIIIIAALTALVTVAMGLMLAANEGHAGALVERHRLRGLSVAILAVFSAAIYLSTLFSNHKKLIYGYWGSLGAAIAMMGLTAHDGGSLVHGPRYLAEYAPWGLDKLLETHTPNNNKTEATQVVSTQASEGQQLRISQASLTQYEEDVRPFFDGYCSRCHGEGKQEAGVRIDKLDPTMMSPNAPYHWSKVMNVLDAHRMPPIEAKQPSKAVREEVRSWIQTSLKEEASARRAERVNAPLRRLTKREYEHTLQDLFKVDTSFTSRLPADPKSEKGYDTNPELLLVSMSDMRLYHDIARSAVERHLHFGVRNTEQDQYLIEMEDVYHYGRLEAEKISYDLAPAPMSATEFAAKMQARKKAKPVYRDRKYGPLPYGHIPTGVVPGVGEGRGFARLHEQFMLIKTQRTTGEVTVRIHAAMLPGKNGDTSKPRLRLEAGWRNEQSLRVENVGEIDISASKDSPEVAEFTFNLEQVLPPTSARVDEKDNTNWLLLVISNAARHEGGTLAGSVYGQADLAVSVFDNPEDAIKQQTESAIEYGRVGMEIWEKNGVPFLLLDAVEVSVTPPLANAETPFIINYPQSNEPFETQHAEEEKIVRDLLETIMPRTHRRPVSSSEVDAFVALFSKMRRNGDDFEQATRETIAALLITPSFLFIGYSPDIGTDTPLPQSQVNSLHLASRLSYLLWSSMPDERLISLAQSGKLDDPRILSDEVDRMIADPKSHRFSETFAKQWLQLRKHADTAISTEIYPEYGTEFGQLTLMETIATFQDNFHNNRDARELFGSEYMFVNDQLARHYGIEGDWGGDLQRIHVGPSQQRAGLLTQASILTMNSNGEDSHPIKRGVWMLERILDDPPPPPPPSVPDLDTNNPELAGLTLKQKIEHHRSLSGCSGCHEKIDPWGIVFENYDAVGAWRDTAGFTKDNTPQPVDALSLFPDGTELASATELADYLMNDREDDVMLSLVHHMMIYTLGRELDILDEQEAKVILRSFRASGYRLSHLIKAIVQSEAFDTLDHSPQKKEVL